VISDVDEQTLILYRQRIVDNLEQAKQLSKLIGKPAITRDGMQLSLMANIELPEDIATTRALQADGVGLYRTEFLYMNRDTPPDEDEHYEAYRSVVEGLNGIPVTIRTLDLGADKQVDGCLGNTPVCNPALGLRAIRLCIKEPRLFLPQLRAILRASAHGPVRIMVPMLSTLSEVTALKQHLEAAKLSLSQDGTPFDPNIQVGGMIEVPAAALSADRFANALDFLSIGTNDLIQYTLAIDRVDDEVNYLFDPLHPAILRLIKMVIDAGRHYNKPVSMCGEMAGDPSYIPLLLGMGLQEYSMQPGALLDAKRLLCELDAGKLSERTDRLFQHLHEADISERIAQICQEY
jgi:phosphotransferase system enzyme I (PtsI)